MSDSIVAGPRARARGLLRALPTKKALTGALLVALVILAAALAGVLDAHAPLRKDVSHGLSEMGMPLGPSLRYPLGTDVLGRCVAARLAHGARLSLLVASAATALALFVGALVGVIAGYMRGLVDTLLMRAVEIVMSFPLLLLGIAAAAALRQRAAGMLPVALVLGLLGWPPIARAVRAKVMVIVELDYVEAARALGAGHLRILARHILPGVIASVLVLGALAVPQMILAEATLAYLGLGAAPPLPAWGRMIAEGQAYLHRAPWLSLAPGVAIALTALGFSLLGEGLREALEAGQEQ